MRAVEELYATYRDDLFRYLCSLTHDPAQAEDLLSETFLQALQSAGSFRGQSSEKTWLFGIARNLWLRALRRRRPTVPLEDLAGLAAGEEPADAAAIAACCRWGWAGCIPWRFWSICAATSRPAQTGGRPCGPTWGICCWCRRCIWRAATWGCWRRRCCNMRSQRRK